MNERVSVQVSREQEQQLELDKLRRELELKRAEALSVQAALQSKEAVGVSLHHTLNNALYSSLQHLGFCLTFFVISCMHVLDRRSAEQCVGGASG